MPKRVSSKEYRRYRDNKMIDLYEAGYYYKCICERFSIAPTGFQRLLTLAYRRTKRKQPGGRRNA